MKNIFTCGKQFRSIVLIAILFAAFQSNAQTVKPSSSGYAPVNGIKVYYEVYGEGKPLVLLHGAFMTINDNWGQLIPELSKTRKVIALEFQGHGHTPFAERKLSLPSFASDVIGVMDYLKVDSADVVGYSMGGSVTYQLLVKYPKRFTKAVIISSTYKSSGWQTEITDAFKTFTSNVFENSPMKDAYEAVAPDKTKWKPFIGQMLGFIKESFDLGDSNIAKINAPVMIIAGDSDGLDKIELMKTYKLLGGGVIADFGVMSKSQLAIVPAQGHVSLMMQTQTILNYLKEFLK